MTFLFNISKQTLLAQFYSDTKTKQGYYQNKNKNKNRPVFLKNTNTKLCKILANKIQLRSQRSFTMIKWDFRDARMFNICKSMWYITLIK